MSGVPIIAAPQGAGSDYPTGRLVIHREIHAARGRIKLITYLDHGGVDNLSSNIVRDEGVEPDQPALQRTCSDYWRHTEDNLSATGERPDVERGSLLAIAPTISRARAIKQIIVQ